MECFSTNINEAPLVPDECQGETKSTSCVLHTEAIPFLDLPAYSTQKDINDALSLSSQSNITRIENIEEIIQDVVIPDGSETKVIAGNNIDVSGVGTESDPYIISTNITTLGSYIVSNEGYSIVGNTLTVNAGWEWKINSVDSTNVAPIAINIPFASVDNTRIDLIVLADNGLIYRVAGTETTETATAPVVPENTIVALFTFSDSTTNDVIVPTPIYPISQQIRDGETTYAPSENTVFDALYLKAYDVDVVHLEGNEVIRNGKKEFVNTSSDNAIEVDNQGAGGGIKVKNKSTGKAILIESETGSTGTPLTVTKNNVEVATLNDSGEYEGTKFIVTDGLTSEFLKANGDLDSTVYEPTTNKQDSLAVDGTGEKFPTVDAVNETITNIYSLLNPNTYVVLDNGFVQVLNDITINAGWEWKIDNNDNSNGADIDITVPLATSGFNRIDIIVLNDSNSAQLISGVEVAGTPVAPTVPVDTINILFLYVDSTVATPAIPRPKSQVSQLIRDGETTYAPSEDVVFDALALKADTTYVDSLLVGLLDDRGNYDASTNLFPSTGGSGGAGAILKGDIWYISVAGTLGGTAVDIGYSVRALVDSPAQTAGNWSILPNSLGYVPENTANKSTTTADSASSVKFPVWSAVVSYVSGLLSSLKTVGGVSLVGVGDVVFKTVNNTPIVGSGDISTIFPVIETGTSSSITDAENGAVIVITSSCTKTIPSGLVAGFECSFVTTPSATLTIVLGGGVTLINNQSLIMLPGLSFTLKNRTSANAYIATGYL